MLDMPSEGEVHLNLPLKNADCKVQMNLTNTNCVGYNGLCKNESHENSNHVIFCVTGKDLDSIDIDSIFDDKVVI